MANAYNTLQTTITSVNTPTPVFTAAASTTLIKSIRVMHGSSTSSATLGIIKNLGTRTDMGSVSLSANTLTHLITDVLPLEAGDVITVESTHQPTYVWVSYVEDTTALAGQAISVLTDVDTSGVVGGDTLVYNSSSGNWEPAAAGGGAVDSVNGQTGVVVLDMDDINDVNASSPNNNDILKWTGSPINAWTPVDWLSVLYAQLKQGTDATITNGSLSESSLELTSTQAKLKAGVTGFDITETSPGTIETIVATDATGSTTHTALTLEGLTTANTARFIINQGTQFYISSGTYVNQLRANTSLTSSKVNMLPASDGLLALDADIPSSTTDLLEGTNLYYTDARVSTNSDVVANTAKRSYPIADETKLAGIAAGAEVNVNADWNATSGDALILNKPTIPTNTNLGNTNLTADNNRTYDIDGNQLTIQTTGGDFFIKNGATTQIEVNPFEVQINSISYPSTDGTSGQVMTTDGAGNLSFTTVSGGGGGGGNSLSSHDQTLTGDRLIDTNGHNLEIELDPTGTADTFTIHDGTHDLFEVNTNTSGTLFSVNDVSGLPTFQSNDDGSAVMPKILTAAPTGTATEGTMQLAIVSGTSYLYVYINGAWRKTTLA